MSLATLELPTLYEYYTGNGIEQGLSDQQPYFTLNNKNITIYSGALHYFRVPRAYWRDRLRKMKAAGLNTVDTYVPWNLHEPQSGTYDFGNGGSDFEDFLHVEEFFKTVQEEDLFALVRPGPFIGAEWDLGGLPSWLLRNTSSVRNSKDKNYISYVKRYFNILLPILALLQFQKGGPILGFQIENEYGLTFNIDFEYLEILKQLFLDNSIIELLYTSDAVITGGGRGTIPGVLQAANFNTIPSVQLGWLKLIQPNKPIMTMEFWTGWYDNWASNHNTGLSPSDFKSDLTDILDFPSSVNLYIFIGGTSFGFLNGANTLFIDPLNSGLSPVTTSYDYGAPITEYGAYTEKYKIAKQLIGARNKIKIRLPVEPAETKIVAYPSLKPEGQILLSDIIDNYEDKIRSQKIVPMEMLPINNNSGQSYGYIVYRKTNLDLPPGSSLTIWGFVRDTVLVLVNGKLVSPAPKSSWDLFGFGFWKPLDSSLTLTNEHIKNATVDLIVENFGRNHYGYIIQFMQFKGLTDDVSIAGNKIYDWEIVPLEFKTSWNNNLTDWKPVASTNSTPALYKFVFNISGPPNDTFLDLSDWNKGITIVNGFVLGRHFFLGPQHALYLPAPLLKEGDNVIVIFEHYSAPDGLNFSTKPIFGGQSH